MNPQWKQLKWAGKFELNNLELFWVPTEATHISLKKGMLSFWILKSNESLPGQYRSTNNRWFIKKQGNTFAMPGFELLPSGYHYESLTWFWHCRKCHSPMMPADLDCLEVCENCNRVRVPEKKRIALS